MYQYTRASPLLQEKYKIILSFCYGKNCRQRSFGSNLAPFVIGRRCPPQDEDSGGFDLSRYLPLKTDVLDA